MLSRSRTFMVFSLALLVAGSGAFAVGLTQEELAKQVGAALTEFNAENPNAKQILDNAKGVLICPSMKKLGFVVGLERGTCVLRVGGETTGYFKTTSAKWGLIAGVEGHSLLMAFNDADALAKFQAKGKAVQIGTDVSVAVAGAGGNVDVGKLLKEPVVAYVFSQEGLMVDLSLEGTTFKKIDVEHELGRLFEVVVTAEIHPGQTMGAQQQFVIGVDSLVTEAQRAAMVEAIRSGKTVGNMEPCGVLRMGRSGEDVPLEWCYATKIDDFNYRMILATRADMPFASSWPQQHAAKSDVKVIQLNVNQNHVGTGTWVFGPEVSWSESESRIVLDTGNNRPINLSMVSTRDLTK